MNKRTKQELISFEEKISNFYKESKIKAPVHLSGGNEEQLIKIFSKVQKEDWVFSNWRSHYHALLKGISPKWLEKEILRGRSMHISNKKYKFFASSIVAGQLPIALGVAMALKKKNSKNHVWAFCGDMAAETGVFHEVTKYAKGHNLPISFIVENNGLSVYTPTKKVWGGSIFNNNVSSLRLHSSTRENFNTNLSIMKYNYKRQWPHHGIGLWIDFPENKKAEFITKKSYEREIKKSMEYLAQNERVLFIGQTVGFKGSPIYTSLEGIVKEKRIELPVMEEVQMGMSMGLSLEGYIPVSIYPRFDFLTLATNQLVNHLDKAKELSNGQFNPKVIIRTVIGSKEPFYPGPQHCQDHTEAYKFMLTNMDVIKLENPQEILSSYKRALENDKSTLLVEI